MDVLGLGGLRRVSRRGLPLILIVAAMAAAIGLASVAGRTAANEAIEAPAESAPVIEPSAPRRALAREELARPNDAPRPARHTAAAGVRSADAARTTRTVAAEPVKLTGRPSAPEPAKVAPAVTVTAEPTNKPAPAEPRASSESLLGVGAKLLLGSLLLAGLLYGAARVMRRMPIAKLLPGADGPIKVIGRAHLGPKTSLALVQTEGVTLLVAVSAAGIQPLHTWSGSTSGTGSTAIDHPHDKGARNLTAPAVPGQLRNLEGRVGGRTV